MTRFALIFTLLLGNPLWADELGATDEALKKTQDLLKNPDQREKAAMQSPEGLKSLENLKKITGGDAQMEQEIWELTAEIMPLLTGDAKGDPAKMNELLDAAKLNPAEFANRFPAAQREKLRQIAEKLAQKKKQP